MKIKLITVGLVSLIGLSGCFNGSSNNLNANATAEQVAVNAYASKGESDEAVAIDDAAMLRADITAVFGNADSEPVAIEDSDTVRSILNQQ